MLLVRVGSEKSLVQDVETDGIVQRVEKLWGVDVGFRLNVEEGVGRDGRGPKEVDVGS